MNRFVILYHELPAGDTRAAHWDFMIQQGSVLTTWAISRRPDQPGETIAERLPDHRLEYLHYEGPISGGRGQVTQWDTGNYREDMAGPDHVELSLSGTRLVGRVVLTSTGDDQRHWRFEFCASRSAGTD